MFGFGRKHEAAANPGFTPERMEKALEIIGRFPGTVPKSGANVTDVGLAIGKAIETCFNKIMFDDYLVKRFSVETRLAPGWSPDDALSRWYALGFICLTHCSMTKRWTEALPVEIGTQVYEASLEFLWLRFRMSEALRKRVSQFMQENIREITSSLASEVDGDLRRNWFNRYSRRICGYNPPWEVSMRITVPLHDCSADSAQTPLPRSASADRWPPTTPATADAVPAGARAGAQDAAQVDEIPAA